MGRGGSCGGGGAGLEREGWPCWWAGLEGKKGAGRGWRAGLCWWVGLEGKKGAGLEKAPPVQNPGAPVKRWLRAELPPLPPQTWTSAAPARALTEARVWTSWGTSPACAQSPSRDRAARQVTGRCLWQCHSPLSLTIRLSPTLSCTSLSPESLTGRNLEANDLRWVPGTCCGRLSSVVLWGPGLPAKRRGG